MLGLVLPIVVLFALNVLTPGASFVLTLRNALAHGARYGRAVALGLSIADITFAVLALFGVAALLRAHAGAVAVIGSLGGVWLGVLGLRMFEAGRGRTNSSGVEGHDHAATWLWAFRTGLVAGLVNPMAIVFFSSVFLANLHLQPTIDQACVLGVSIAIVSVALRASIATIASHRAVREGYLARRRQFELVSAAALFSFGMKLAVHAMYPFAVRLLLVMGIGHHVI